VKKSELIILKTTGQLIID